jgi:hypothetical protein
MHSKIEMPRIARQILGNHSLIFLKSAPLQAQKKREVENMTQLDVVQHTSRREMLDMRKNRVGYLLLFEKARQVSIEKKRSSSANSERSVT